MLGFKDKSAGLAAGLEKPNQNTGEIFVDGPHSELWVRLTAEAPDILDTLATLDPERPQWGGSRRCPEHPEAALIRKTTLTCSECGRLVNEQITTMRPATVIASCDGGIGDTKTLFTEGESVEVPPRDHIYGVNILTSLPTDRPVEVGDLVNRTNSSGDLQNIEPQRVIGFESLIWLSP